MKTLEPISRIILQTPAKFKETVSQGFREVSKFPHYGIDDAVASTENKYTKYAKTCSILGMSNGIESYVGHFAIPANLSNFLKNLDIIIRRFKEHTGQLSAVITGGYDYQVKDIAMQPKESFELGVGMASLLDKHSADLSMIFGKIDPVFSDSLAVTKDAFVLSHSNNICPQRYEDYISKNLHTNDIEGLLAERYEVCEIDSKHKLYIKG